MYKLAVVVFLAGTLRLLAADAPQDPAVVLAEILQQKGTISSADLSRIQAADDHNRLNVLAAILQEKGVLDTADLARLSSQSNEPVFAQSSRPAAAQPVIPAKPAPPISQTAEVPVTTKKGLPVSLYGEILFTTGFNDAVFNYTDVPMVASKQGSDPTGGDKNFYGSGRQTRLGLNLDPIDALGGKLSGRFEFDMMGGEAPYTNGINMNLFRMRLGYGRVDWDNFAIEAGQDWSVFTPLNPTSLNEFGIPEFTATGNPWIRLPQLRVEAKTRGGSNNLLWQFAASDPDMGDYSTTSISVARTPGAGERGRLPSLQSRLAWTATTHDDRAYTVGLSGDYGRGKNAGTIGSVEVQPPIDSWGAALDYTLPFTKLFNVTGEAYIGRALGIYGVASGEAIGTVGTTGAHGVLSRGGWIQGQFNFTKQWQVNLAYGIDNPEATELPVGSRNRNQQYMANLIDRLTKNISASLEYRRILTDYRNQIFANERGDHVDLGVAYIF